VPLQFPAERGLPVHDRWIAMGRFDLDRLRTGVERL